MMKRRDLMGNMEVVRMSVICHVFKKRVHTMSTLKQKRAKMNPVTENKDVHCVVKHGYERNF
jgi:hypothetical protein